MVEQKLDFLLAMMQPVSSRVQRLLAVLMTVKATSPLIDDASCSRRLTSRPAHLPESPAMLFQVKNLGTETESIAQAIKAYDARAQIKVDRDASQIKVLGLLSTAEALAAFQLAGFDASPVGTEQPHVSGSSNCCGSCA